MAGRFYYLYPGEYVISSPLRGSSRWSESREEDKGGGDIFSPSPNPSPQGRGTTCGGKRDNFLLFLLATCWILLAGLLPATPVRAAVSFAPAVNYSVGTNPWSIAVGDCNNDGKLDLAVANNNSNNVSILLGNGDGTFAAGTTLWVGLEPRSVTGGDFNNDGNWDLAVADYGANNIDVFKGNGNGTFTWVAFYAVGTAPRAITAADFNGDGQLDLAVVNEGSNNVSLLLGNGDATFQAAINAGVGSSPFSLVSGDFNGDNKLDLAVANWGANTASILLGNGDGTFQAAVPYSVGQTPSSVTAGDFNGDGKLDLAVANYWSNNVSILLGNGNGSFQAAVNYGVGTGPYSVTSGDFNGDGKRDLATANFFTDNVSVLEGKGDGTFQAAAAYTVGDGPQFVTTGDFNGDGKMDLAVANGATNNVSILLNDYVVEITVTPTSKDFGNVVVGSSSALQTFIITNTGVTTLAIGALVLAGTNPAEFSKQNDNASNQTLAAGASKTVQVDFRPTSAGLKSAILNIPNNSQYIPMLAVNLSGTGLAPNISVSPASHNFGFLDVGLTSPPQTFTISNTGDANLTVQTITLSGTNAAEFLIQNDSASGQSIAPSTNKTCQVVFKPTSTGSKSAALNIPSNDPDTPTFTVSLTAVGGTPNIAPSPTSYNFGYIDVGTSSGATTLTINNTGTANLTLGTITKSGTNAAEFTIQNDLASGQVIAPSTNKTVQVVFSPATAGAKSAALNIPSDDPDTPTFTLNLTGTGGGPNIAVSPVVGNFGTVAAPPSSPILFTITNNGNVNLTVGTINTTSPDFIIQNDNASGQVIAPSTSKTFEVVFNPAAQGVKSATLSIPSDDPNTPTTVNLSGTWGSYSLTGVVKRFWRGFAGVTVTLTSGGTPVAIATTNAGGVYTFTSLPPGSYTITPSMTGYMFIPQLRNVTIASANIAGQNFIIMPIPKYMVAGKIRTPAGTPMPWLTVTLTNVNDPTKIYTSMTNLFDGAFIFFVPNGNYTLTPGKCGYDFNPSSLALTVANRSYWGLVFTLNGSFPSLIYGKVIKTDGTAFAGVTVTLSGSCDQTVTTDKYGRFYFRAAGGSYTLTPSHGADTFSPPSFDVTITGYNPPPIGFRQQ